MDSLYYRVLLLKKNIVFFVGLLHSFHDNLVFERIENKNTHEFELFISPTGENELLLIMNLFLEKNIILSYKKKNISESSIYKK